jgi:hypothetical protein
LVSYSVATGWYNRATTQKVIAGYDYFTPTKTNLSFGPVAIYYDKDLLLPADAMAMPKLREHTGASWSKEDTRLWLVTDLTNIKVFVYCQDRDMGNVIKKLDSGPWESDSIELFFSNKKSNKELGKPTLPEKTSGSYQIKNRVPMDIRGHRYSQIILSCDGRFLLTKFKNYYLIDNNVSYDNRISSKVTRVNDGFLYEITMPKDSVGINSIEDGFYFQFVRNYRGQFENKDSVILQEFPDRKLKDRISGFKNARNHDSFFWEKVNLEE